MKIEQLDLDLLLQHLLVGARGELSGWGIRDYSGQYNNALNPVWGSADRAFSSLASQVAFRAADVVPVGLGFGPPAGTPTAYDNTSTFIVDSHPREISNLIADEPVNIFSGLQTGVLNGLPTSKLHTLYGQFFTHDLDLVPKGANGTIVLNLLVGDPLYAISPFKFMTLSRANFTVVGGEREYSNLISSWVDLGPTYGTHPVMTALLKEYDGAGVAGVATGRLLEHTDPNPALNNGMPNWADVKANALRIGITLLDNDVLNLPMLRFNADGSLFRNASGSAEIELSGGLPVHTGHAFLDDLSRNAVPSGKTADIDSVIGLTGSGSTFYDDELLAIHFIAGDGRANENYMLTSVHGLFFAEHNRVYAELQALVAARGPAYAAQWSGEMLFEAARQVVEAQYSQISFDEYVARLSPNLDTYAAFAGALDPAVSNEFAHAIFRFGHTQTSPSHNVISQTGHLTGDIALLQTFLAPATFATTNVGGTLSGVGSHAYTTSELAGMARVRANEIDEFFVDGLRNTLLGLPLDLTAINIARGRDIGLPSLNALRRELFAQTGLGTLAAYTSWNDFGAHLLNPGSLKHFLMAYAGQALFAFQSTYATTTDWANARATDWAAYKLVLDTAATAALADTAFMGAGGNNNYELIDIYIGGLAEAHVPGGLLGSTYDFITAVTLGPLRNSDRFAELNRLFGSDLGYEVRGTTLADVIRNNATPVASVPAAASPDGFNLQRTRVYGDAFAVPDMILEIGTSGTWAATPPARPSGLQSYIDISDPRIGAGWSLGGSTFTATALSELIGGTALANTILAGLGNDTVYADAGADNVDGGAGHDWLYGGDGNDTLSGGADNDILHGQADNDNLAGGAGADKLFGEAGDDTLAGDGEADLLFGAAGNDLLLGGAGADELAGGDGADTLDGGSGADTLDGGGGADVAVYAGAQAAYTVAHAVGGGYTVTQISSGAIDALSEIETIQFTGSSINLSSGTVAINDLSVVEGQTVGINNTLANLSGLTITGLQWQQSTSAGAWVPIAGATGATLALAQAQVGHHVRVLVSFTDPVGAGGQMLAWPTAEVININNAASGSVSVAGSANVGFSLSAITTALVDIDGLGALSYQWLRNASPVAGATAVSYLLSAADLGATMSVRVNYTDAFGTPESMTSAPSALINDGNDPPSGSVTVSGSATIGSTLTAAHTLSDPDGLGAINWRWQSSPTGATWTNVVDLGTSSLVVNAALGGLLLRAQAFYTDGLGTPEAVASAATAIVPGITFNVINGDEAANNLLGTASADQINGFGGNDTLTGGAGTDLLVGGAGGLDFYFVDSAADGIIELSTGGYDVVRASVDYTLGANLEELWLEGTANLSATGNDLNNNFLGNSGGNLIIGGLGNDFLNGNTGADTLIGGLGNDHYVTDTLLDNVVEMTGEGVDKVSSFITWTLGANLENLTLLNSVAGDATGNELANLITGSTGINTLAGLDGNDTLSGLGGNDLMLGGTGVDTALYTTASTGSVLTRTGDNTYTVSTGAELDTLQDIEFAQFSNTTLALTTGSLAIDDSTPQAGQTLNVLSTLANSQSLTVTSTQWQMFDTSVGGGTWVAIAGATNFSFSAGAAQTGKALRVSLTFTDPLGAGQIALSAATAPVSANGANSPAGGSPTITGTPTEDQTLSANTSTITDADGLGAFSFEWLRAGSPIAAATNPTYTLADADVGQVISLRVSFTDGLGTSESLTSAATAAVTNVNDSPAGAVTLSGNAAVGNTLSAETGTLSDADGLGALAYQWTRDGNAIAGAVSSTYTLVIADVNAAVRAVVSYTDSHGTPESVTSDPSAPVGSSNNPPSGVVTIVGTATEDLTLAAMTAGINDADGLGAFSYQWLRAGAPVAGANASIFALGDADVGLAVSVRVSYTDGLGFAESLTSAATAAVANVNDPATGVVTITGVATENQTLSANTAGIVDLDGLGVFGYQWLRGGTPIVGATASTYLLADADVGEVVSVRLNFIDARGSSELLTSAATATVINVNDLPTGSVTVSGSATIGSTLTAAHTLADADGLGPVSWRWQSSPNGTTWTNVVDLGPATLVVNAALGGLQLRAQAFYTDLRGAAEIVSSAATAAVPTIAFNVINGDANNNTLLGTAAADQINGLNGNDTIDGSTGFDMLIGGAGNEIYTLENAADGVVEAAASGWDVVRTSTLSLALGANIEELWIDGAAALDGWGNDLGNNLRGNSAANRLFGAGGNDQLLGFAGSDTMDGGAGADTATFAGAIGGSSIVRTGDNAYRVTTGADVDTLLNIEFVKYVGAVTTTTALTTGTLTLSDITPSAGQAISAVSTLANTQSLTITATQWQMFDTGSWVPIAGATNTSFTPGAAQAGKALRVALTFTDPLGAGQVALSVASAPVSANSAAQGSPVIVGTATEDQVLSANTSGISDVDGLGAFSYQWLRAGLPIAGAAASTYTLGDADVGQPVSVRVSYFDGLGFAESLTSSATAAVANVNDAPSGSLTISGTPTQGVTLSANTAGINDADGLGAFAFEWLRDGASIGGAAASTYALGNADVGHAISVRVSYVDAQGTPESLTSAATAPVGNANDAPTGAVIINGSATEDQTLSADTSTIGDADGLGAFSYQWLRAGAPIAGATATSYTLADADVGLAVSVRVSYTDGSGFAESLTSAATAAVVNVNDPATGAVTITGTATEDQTLSANTAGIVDLDGLGAFGYQWLRAGAPIVGATTSSYVLGDADVGEAVSVRVNFIDAGGSAELLTSTATAAIANVNDLPTGSVTVSGSATIGSTLTAAHTLADADGLGPVSWRWQSSPDGSAWTNVVDLGPNTLVVNAALGGLQLRAQAFYTDARGAAEIVSSAATAVVPTIAFNVINGDDNANNLAGTAAADQINGLGGNDTLTGGAGADLLIAGTGGLDFYIVDSADDGVVELSTGGYDVVRTSTLSLALGPNIEELWIDGAASLDGWGNELNNNLRANNGANRLFGAGGADQLTGFAGNDTMDGGAGSDTATFSGAIGGSSIVRTGDNAYTVTTGVEVDTLLNMEFVKYVGAVTTTTALTTGTLTLSDVTPSAGQAISAVSTLANTQALTITATQWQMFDTGSWVPIAGATNTSFTPGAAQAGKALRVALTFTDPIGAGQIALSAASAPVSVNNNPATGTVLITGTPTEDQTLSADTSGISDPDGLGAFSYQWLRAGAAIAGASASSYTLGDTDVGQLMSVRVSFTDALGSSEVSTSAATAAVANVNDAPSGSPTISGGAVVSNVLSADTSAITDLDGLGAFSYQWTRDGSPIAGAVASSYTLAVADLNTLIRVVVTYTDALGTPESLTSAPTAPVGGSNSPAQGSPTITGSATEDQTLTADTSGITDPNGLGAFSYAWLRAGSPIVGATAATYTLGDADVGQLISLRVSFTDGLGFTESLTSTATAAVANVNDPATGSPAISGTTTEDQTLTADTSGINDIDGLGAFSYEWLRAGSPIVGATASTYLLGDADVGLGVSLRVSFTDIHGGSESLTSAATAAVANVNDAPSGAVVINGTATIGSTLGADTSTVADLDGLGTFAYQWTRDGSPIAGAVASTYQLVGADLNTVIRVVVSYDDARGTSEAVVSAPTAPITGSNSPAQGSPTISGTAAENQVLSAGTAGITDGNGLGAFSYQWLRAGAPIAGATATTYTLGDADVGLTVAVRVSFTDGLGFAESLTSAATAAVANVNDAPSGAVTVSGTATENQILTANTAAITDADGLGAFSYQWLRDGEVIVGATASTRTLDDADVGTRVSVRVSYTDAQGTPEALLSAATTTVANVNDLPTGSVTVSGSATIGSTLTAAHTLADADGLGPVSWRWQSSPNGTTWTNVVDLGPATLVVNAALGGLQLRAQAFYTDLRGAAEIVSSAATAAVPTIAFNVINGDANNNTLLGTAAADQINGLNGNDTIDGSTGFDMLIGGAGNEIYTVADAADGVVEAAASGWDVVRTSTLSLALGANIEELWIDGAAALDGWGNDLGNNLRGNSAANRLFGAGGNDQLLGFAGSDTMDGGAGSDTATFSGAIGGSSIVRTGDNAYRVTTGADVDTLLNSEFVKYVGAVTTTTALTTGTLTLSDITPSAGQAISAVSTLANTQSLTITATQWQMFDTGSWVPIAGATNTSFTPGAAQAGKALRVALTFTDPLGAGQVALSVASAPVQASAIGAVADNNGAGNTVAEDAIVGTQVGITALALEPDVVDTVTYSLDVDAGGRFAINASTGVVTVAAALDRELFASHQITVRATSSDASFSTANFTVLVSDVDEFDVGAVSDSNGAVNTLAENALAGALAGVTASAADADATTNTITFSLSDDAGGRFTIDGGSGVVTLLTSLDFEAFASHSITVLATSADGSTSSQAFTIAVTDVSEAAIGPVADNNGAANTVAEDAIVGTQVGITAFALEPDVVDTVTYSLDDTAGGRFAINGLTGVVTVAAALDRELFASHQITVRATSSDASFSTANFTVLVSDVDEFDVGAVSDSNGAVNTLAENALAGALAGVTASAADADATTNTITFSLSDDAGGRFTIDGGSGVVTLLTSLDFEAFASHSITVLATSADGSTSSQAFTIAVTDVSEAAIGPVADNNGGADTVAEDAIVGTQVGITALALEPDVVDTVTYSLDVDAGGRFAINASTGVVTVAAALDRELFASHQITVRATSSDASFSTANFTVLVSDVDEFDVGAVSDSNGAVNTLAENALAGALAGVTASAADADATTNTITFSLSDDAGGRFTIDGGSGVVTLLTSLDFEAFASHSITVLATSADGSTSSQAFTIAVTDVSEAAIGPVADNNGGADTVAEDAIVGTQVGITALALEPDVVDTVTYSLDVDAGGRFAINASTGVVTVAAALDRELFASHQITVRATSSDASFSTANFTVLVSDVDEFDVGAVSDSNGAVNTLAENALAGALAGVTASAADADATTNTITFSLSDDAGGRFTIDGGSGVVTLLTSLDFEAFASHSITVLATSADGSTSSQAFTIAVTDVSEAAIGPVADNNGGADTVAEDAIVGTQVGITALALEPDVVDTVTYSLDVDAGGRFAINASTGVVTVAAALDRELFASHQITVRATSSDASFSTANFTVLVSDVDEFDVGAVSDSNGAVNTLAENALAGALAGVTASAADADATTNTITFSLSDDAGGRFTIDGGSGVVTLLTSLDFEAFASHSITVLATSADGSTSSQAFTIAVTDVSEAAIGPVADNNGGADTVAEDAIVGTQVGITALALEPDVVDTVTYSLDVDAGGRFAINASTGVVTVAAALDRELFASHQITVRATSSDASFSTANFTVLVSDVDEFDVGAVSDSNGAVNTLAENALAGALAGVTASAADADATTNTITFSLSDDAGGRFTIDGGSGVVTLLTSLDFEAFASHSITVLATSADGSTSSQAFTIAVTDVSEAAIGPVADNNGGADTVAEDAIVGTQVGITALALEPDVVDTVTYSLDVDAGGRFAINASTGVVTVAAALDRELFASHQITVRATSSDASFSTANFTVLVSDVDEFDVGAVSDSNGAVNTLAENALAGALAGVTASAADADATTNTITFSLSDDAGGRFTIDGGSGVVTLLTSLDFEAFASHSITVLATSADGSTSSQAFTIAVTDVSEAAIGPVADNNGGADTVAEDAIVGTQVGITALALEPDVVDTVTYSLDVDAGGRFAINASTGVVTVAAALDRELFASHQITVRATSSDASFSTANFTVLVSDVDEFDVGAVSDSNGAVNTLAENALAGALAGVTASAADADATTNTITFSLSDDAGGRFTIDGGSGVVTLLTSLDFEAFASHSITVLATSADGSTSSQAFTIAVTDVSEAAIGPVADNNGGADTVAEDAIVGTQVGITALALEPDVVDTVTYSLDVDAGGRFAINASTGVVTVAAALDRELFASHQITVRATSSDASFSTANFTVLVSDVDEFDVGAVSDSNGAVNTLAENALAGALAGVTASAADADATTNTITFSLSDDAGGRFTIDGGSGVVTLLTSLDFEAFASHSITVLATSADGSTSSQAFTIAVTDVSEAAIGPVADNNGGADTVAEDAIVGTQVGITALALEPDVVDTVTYSLDVDAGGRFAINASTGVVTVAAALDRELFASHQITVRATSSDASFSTANFTVLVSDVDEFDVGAVSDSNGAVNTLAENALAGALAGVTASAADADATTNTITFSLSDDAGGRFTIDGGSGVVTLLTSLDFEAFASHSITVLATSADGSTSSQAFTIAVTDVSEAAIGPVADNNGGADTVAEDAIVGTQVGITALALEPDVVDTVTYSLDVDAGGRFAINASTGVVTVAAALDRELFASHQITVRATSSDASFTTEVFTIAVSDVDEFNVGAVTDTNGAVNTLAENALAGALAGVTASAADADATNNVISFSLSDAAGGRFAIDGGSGVVTLLTSLDFEAFASHSITVLASSSDGSTSSEFFSIAVTDVNDAEEVLATNAGITVLEGRAAAVTGSMLLSTDADTSAANLVYVITNASDTGTLSRDNVALALNDSFTQADINNGLVVYTHDGSDTASDSFDFSVDDGQGATSSGSFLASITEVTDQVGTTDPELLDGSAGNDEIRGLDGDDYLIGRSGTDLLFGGEGADVFQYLLPSDSPVGDSARDVIADFLSGIDRIDLSGLDADADTGGDQAFTSIGENAAYSGAGQLSYHYEVIAGTEYTVIEGNVDAGLAADFQIALIGHLTFPAIGPDILP